MVIRIIISVLLMLACATSSRAEEFSVRKVILSRFKVKNDVIVDLPKMSPYWPEVNRGILAIDNQGRIYILNLWNNEILVFNDQGKLRDKISLPMRLYRFEHMNGEIEVSGDGKRLFVEGYDQSNKMNQILLDQNGKIVRQFISDNEIIWNFPDARLCNKPYYLFKKGGLLYDENFYKLSGQYQGFVDSEGKYTFDFEKRLLIKLRQDGGRIWEKQFNTNIEIVGLDANSFLYIVTRLKNDDPDYLYKLNSKGKILAKVPIPKPFPLLTQEEKEDFYALISEEPFASFKLTCNGDVYLIFRLNKLPEPAFKRWLKGGEYFIYKFETLGK